MAMMQQYKAILNELNNAGILLRIKHNHTHRNIHPPTPHTHTNTHTVSHPSTKTHHTYTHTHKHTHTYIYSPRRAYLGQHTFLSVFPKAFRVLTFCLKPTYDEQRKND
eukprot:GHVS01074042.1.p1 GENE.GHVS01074042.1~~GHVS01074042.1.p1  ORF type:complete len:108 (-),score=3.40 GHVS01074042.1:191-514(-)